MRKSLAQVADLVRRETGMTLSAARETALSSAVARAAPGLGSEALVREAADPVRGRHLIERLIDEVTVRETTFLRDRDQLDTIAWHSLLRTARAAGSGSIRVWSAGCASGEEAYTLALLAAEAFAQETAAVDVLGTDVSGAAIAAATAGRYRERAVSAVTTAQRHRHFERQADSSYVVADGLRSLVRFRRHNLAGDPIPPLGEDLFEVVVCRNVLIYFNAQLAEHVIDALKRSLRPGGMLVLGAADALQRTTSAVTRSAQAVQAGRPARLAIRTQSATRCRPLTTARSSSREEKLTAVLKAADRGQRDAALAQVISLVADNPLDADAHFIHGLVALEAGEPAVAAAALRRALYNDSAFALAAFTLGRAYDALDDVPAARRAYEQALRTLDPEDSRHDLMLQQVDIGDIAAACRARLGGGR